MTIKQQSSGAQAFFVLVVLHISYDATTDAPLDKLIVPLCTINIIVFTSTNHHRVVQKTAHANMSISFKCHKSNMHPLVSS